MHSEEVSERIAAPNRHSFQEGLPDPCYTEQLPHPTLPHSPNGIHVPCAAGQPLNYAHSYFPDARYQADTIREPTIDPTEGEDINDSGMMNTPYRPYPATYSFDGSSPLRISNQMEPRYEYGRPYGPSFTHASSYGHQPLEQHYDNSFGGQER